jgi:hypothetical protein
MSRSAGDPRMDDLIRDITGRLVVEYRGTLSPATVSRCVAQCRYHLEQAGLRAGLHHAVEAMARHRLRELREIHTAASAPDAGVAGSARAP